MTEQTKSTQTPAPKGPTPKQVRDQYLETRTLPKGWVFDAKAPDLVRKMEK